MDNIQRKKILWRVPLFATALFALCGGAWSLFGTIPSTRQFFLEQWAVNLSSSLSLWWIIPLVPVITFIICYVLSSEGDLSKKNTVLMAVVSGTILIVAIVASQNVYVTAFFLALLAASVWDLKKSLIIVLGPIVFLGLIAIMTTSPYIGGFMMICVASIAFSSACIGASLKKVHVSRIPASFEKWLTGKAA